MIFSLQSVSEVFKATFQNNYFHFGIINSSNECFQIHMNDFVDFFNTIIEILQSLDNNLVTKKLFFENFQKSHNYYWQIFQTSNQIQAWFIKLVCESTLNVELYSLIFTKEQMYKFLNCFQYFLFTSLPLDVHSKVWLKYCSTLSLENLKDNCILLYKEAEKFESDLQIKCDLFLLMENFHHYFNLVKVYKHLNSLNDDLNNIH